MQLASMVHGTGRNERREASQHLPQQQNFYYPQSQPRAQQHQPVSYNNSYSANANPYFQQPQQHHQLQQADYGYQRAPQSPPSPPGDELGKPSLPSISSLLHIAGPERMTSDTGSPKHQSSPQHQQDLAQQHNAVPQTSTAEERPEPAYQPYAQPVQNAGRMALPPTPPMRPDSVDGVHSPSTISSHSSFAHQQQQPYYLGHSLNNIDPHAQRQTAPPFATVGGVTSAGPSIMKRHSLPSQSTSSPYGTSAGNSYTNSPYASSPAGSAARGYYSPEAHVYPSAGLYDQRPLPSNFPPPPPPVQIPLTSAVGPSSAPASTNAAHHAHLYGTPQTHQHHHYISASSASALPQSQDRYICTTCNKAFSRPSSLRIHIHSHTGEKPFKCPHAGCGKAFSVRSNMKRHERGCHAGGGGGGMM